MKTIAQFTQYSGIEPSLIRAVVRQIGGWQYFKESAQDVASHGADTGWSGFTYYTDTVPFAKRNFNEIMKMANEMAQDFGSDGPISLVAGFNCLKGETQESVADGLYNSRSDTRTTIFNALAWFALEEVAQAYEVFAEQYAAA